MTHNPPTHPPKYKHCSDFLKYVHKNGQLIDISGNENINKQLTTFLLLIWDCQPIQYSVSLF